jgi:hypothetical protein
LGVASGLSVTGGWAGGTDLVGEENSVDGVGSGVSGSTVGLDGSSLEGKELTSERGGVAEWGLGGVLGAEGWGDCATAVLAEGNGVGDHEARSLVELRDELSSVGEGGSVGDGTSWEDVGSLSVDGLARRWASGGDEGVVATGLVGHQDVGVDGEQDLTAAEGVHALDSSLDECLVGWATDTHLTELVDDDGEGAVSERGGGSLELGHLADEGVDVVLLHELVDLSHVGHVSGITEVLVAHLNGAEGLQSRGDDGSVLGPEDGSVLQTGLLGLGQLGELRSTRAADGQEGVLAGLDIGGRDSVSGSGLSLGGTLLLCLLTLCLCLALGLAGLGLAGGLAVTLRTLALLLGDGGTCSQAGAEEESERVLHVAGFKKR